MSVIGCFALDFDIETVRFLYVKDKAFETPLICLGNNARINRA